MSSILIAIITAIIWVAIIALVSLAIFKLFQIEKHLRSTKNQSVHLNEPDPDDG